MMYFIKIVLFMEALQLAAVGLFRTCLLPPYRNMVAAGDISLVVAIPLVGLFGHDKNVFYGFLFLVPLLWTSDPTRLAKRYVLALMLFPELAEVYEVGGAYWGTLSAPICLNAGALVALAVTRRSRLKPVRSIDVALWAIFLVAVLLFTRGVPLGGTARYVTTTFLLVVPPYFVIARAIASPKAAGDTISFVVLGGVCNAVVGIFESVRHWAIYQSFNEALHVKLAGLSASLAMRAGLLRAGGAVANYETLGLVAGTSLIAAISVRQRFTAPGFYAVVVVLTGGLFVSQARSAWIATLIGLVLHALYERRWKRVAIVVGGFSIAAAMAFAFSSANGVMGQLLGKSGHGEATTQYRQSLLERSLDEARRHPLTGQTLDQLQVSMNDLRQGEHIIDFVNTHLMVMLVGGAGALLLWLSAWGVAMAVGWRRRPAAKNAEPAAPALPFALVGMIFVFLIFTSPTDRILSLAAIAMGFMSVSVRLPSAVTSSGRSLGLSKADAAKRFRIARLSSAGYGQAAGNG